MILTLLNVFLSTNVLWAISFFAIYMAEQNDLNILFSTGAEYIWANFWIIVSLSAFLNMHKCFCQRIDSVR